jgi:hypothetical protein
VGRGLATHPKVVVAEAKVASAEAELRQTRFEVARELMTFWGEWKAAEQEAAQVKKTYEKGAVPIALVIQAKAKLDQIESQVPYLLGTASGTRAGAAAALREAGPKRAPQGPQVEKVLKALDEPVELEFIDTPLRDVAATLSDLHKVNMTTDPAAADVPVSASIRDVPLAAALQMIEDTTPGVRFVVTDYGLLATSDTSENAARYVSASEFWREQGSQPGALSRQPSTAPRAGAAATKGPPPRGPAAHPSADPFAPNPRPAQANKPPEAKGNQRPSVDPFSP